MKLLILGNYSTDPHMPEDFGAFDMVWALNRYYEEYPDLNPDMVLQLHTRAIMERNWGVDGLRRIANAYNKTTARVCVINKDEYPDVNHTIEYPLKEVLSRFNKNYFACSITYALAFAAIRGISQIYLRGFHMINSVEYTYQVIPTIKMIQELNKRNHIINVPILDTWLDFAKITGVNLDVIPELETMYHERV